MPVNYLYKYIRQKNLEQKKGGIVIPKTATVLSTLPDEVKKIVKLNSPTTPPNKFYFHYIDYPFDKNVFSDGYMLNNQIYEFSLRDAVIATFDLPQFSDDEFCWSFATEHQTAVLTALKPGETFDVKLKKQYKKIQHIQKYHFPSGVPDSGYGKYAVHLNTEINSNWYRIVSAYEHITKKTESRLPFFFGFRIFGFRRDSRLPIWRQLLSEAVLFSQSQDWGMGLLNVAFALESFIDLQIKNKLKRSNLGDHYTNHVLQVADRRYELRALYHEHLEDKEINKLAEKLNKEVFTKRNKLAHGDILRSQINSKDFITAIKCAVEFIWDQDINARKFLIPIMFPFDMSSLIDPQLLKNCGAN